MHPLLTSALRLPCPRYHQFWPRPPNRLLNHLLCAHSQPRLHSAASGTVLNTNVIMSSRNLKVIAFWLETELLNLSSGPHKAWPSSLSPAQARPLLCLASGPLRLLCARLKCSYLPLSPVCRYTHTHTHVQAHLSRPLNCSVQSLSHV